MATTEIVDLGLYIHIPFCKSKCFYCDFNSYSNKEHYFEQYINALKKEISHTSKLMKASAFKTIFIGGGTPSILPNGAISEIISVCRQFYNIETTAEITIESNPGTLTSEKLDEYMDCGINRLSMGLQAWQDTLLKRLGRIHRLEDFLSSLELAKRSGFTNINVDLIFSLPGQTFEQWKQTIDEVIKLKLTHISCYSLIIEEGTAFGDKYAKGELEDTEDELDRRMYWYAVDKLTAEGFKHYEISNFAKQQFECKHNLIYWKAEQYLGLGAGAHSYIDGRRYGNVSDVQKYIDNQESSEKAQIAFETIDEYQSMQEYIMLGFRLTEGISFQAFKDRYKKDMLELFNKNIHLLIERHLVEIENGYIKLTKHGLDFANQVFCEFI